MTDRDDVTTADQISETATGATASRGFVLALMLAMIAAQFARMPDVILGGRVWGEEGLFLQAALSRGVVGTMLWRAPVGYYNLQLNVAALVASRLPLMAAPLVMTGLASLLLITPLSIAALDPAWRTRRHLALVAVCVLLVAPSGEVWLNVASGQFVLSIATALLLVTSARRRGTVGLRLVALATFGLCGVASVMLLPLFLFRVLLKRTKKHGLEAAMLGTCLVIQVVLLTSGTDAVERHRLASPQVLAGIVVSRQILQTTIYPFDNVLNFNRADLATAVSSTASLHWLMIATALALHAGVIVWAWRVRERRALWLGAAAGLLLVGSLLATVDPTVTLIMPDVGQRYIYAPNVLLALAIGLCVLQTKTTLVQIIFTLWLACGLLDFVCVERNFLLPCNWYDQVRAWQADPSHPIKHAPRGWTLLVPPSR